MESSFLCRDLPSTFLNIHTAALHLLTSYDSTYVKVGFQKWHTSNQNLIKNILLPYCDAPSLMLLLTACKTSFIVLKTVLVLKCFIKNVCTCFAVKVRDLHLIV